MEEDKQSLPPEESFDDRAERVLRALESEPPGDDASDGKAANDAGGAAPPTPPVSWSKEEKAAFAQLSPEAQAAVARREAERERLLTSRTQDLSRREREIADERQRVTRELDSLIGEAARDPVLIEGSRTDWARLQRENPAEHARRWPDFQQRVEALEAARRNRGTLSAESQRSHAARESELLVAKAPEFAEPAKRQALADELDGFLRQEGFTREEIGGINDHRAVLIVRDAMRWRQQESARKSLATKKVAAAPRTERPGGVEERAPRSERVATLRRRAAATGKLDDRAAYVLAALDDEA